MHAALLNSHQADRSATGSVHLVTEAFAVETSRAIIRSWDVDTEARACSDTYLEALLP